MTHDPSLPRRLDGVKREVMIYLSTNFTLEELTFSQIAARQGIDNTPEAIDIQNLRRLCAELLEPARAILRVPLHVDSGFRSPPLNAAVGGSAVSAHMAGLAADVIPIGLSVEDAFHVLLASALRYDQLIFECREWLHLGLAPATVTPRREALLATGHAGAWEYTAV